MSPPATVVLASTESILVDVVWLVDNIITEPTSTNIIRVTSGRLACDTFTSYKINSGSRSSISTRYVVVRFLWRSPGSMKGVRHRKGLLGRAIVELRSIWKSLKSCRGMQAYFAKAYMNLRIAARMANMERPLTPVFIALVAYSPRKAR